jgi:hypothetical protein
LQLQGQAAQVGVAHVHAHHGTTRQQKRQQVAQVELEVDAGHQQHQQRHGHHPARPGGQDVHVVLAQGQAVGALEACGQPAIEAAAQRRTEAGGNHGVWVVGE